MCLPKPLCQCRVCAEAREKGAPYSRYGCSLYLRDTHTLIDTPEDISHALNHSQIEAVDTCLYSHWDPDHTLGMRIFEQLRLDWSAYAIGEHNPTPIEVYALDGVMSDLNGIRSKHGALLDYYEYMKLIHRNTADEVQLGSCKVTLIPVDETRSVTVFVFEQCGKKLIYAPCDVKPFPHSPLFEGTDCMIIGNHKAGFAGIAGYEHTEIFKGLFSLEEIQELKARYAIPKVILTHIEEDWGMSYGDYAELEKTLEGTSFAYDGMEIDV